MVDPLHNFFEVLHGAKDSLEALGMAFAYEGPVDCVSMVEVEHEGIAESRAFAVWCDGAFIGLIANLKQPLFMVSDYWCFVSRAVKMKPDPIKEGEYACLT